MIVGVLETLERLGFSAARLDAAWWLAIPLLVTMLAVMPALVRRIWKTSPLEPGPLREAIEQACRDRQCQVRDILVWHTNGTMANAAVVGLSRRLRSMLLSDVLLRRLTLDQIVAVVRHELAHLRRWHLPLRLALMLLPVVVWVAAKQVLPEWWLSAGSVLATRGDAGRFLAVAALPVGMLIYAIVVVGWYSRLLEHDADLDACLNEAGQFDPEAARHFVSCSATLLGRSSESRITQWMHPSFHERLRFIERAAAASCFGQAFRRRLARICLVILATYTMGLAVIACR